MSFHLVLLEDLARSLEGKATSQTWRVLAFKPPESMLGGRSWNWWPMAMAIRTVRALQSMNREELSACSAQWGAYERLNRLGIHGPEAFGHYEKWSFLAEVAACLALHTAGVRTEALRSTIRQTMSAWILTAQTGSVIRRHPVTSDRWDKGYTKASSKDRLLYRGPVAYRAGFRDLPWSWFGTMINPMVADCWGIYNERHGAWRRNGPLQRAWNALVSSEEMRDTEGRHRLFGWSDDDRRAALRVLHASRESGSPDQFLYDVSQVAGVGAPACVVGYEIVLWRTLGWRLTFKSNRNAGSNSAGRWLHLATGPDMADHLIGYPFVGNRVRGRRNVGTGHARWTPFTDALQQRQFRYECVGNGTFKRPVGKARRQVLVMQFPHDVYRVTLRRGSAICSRMG